MMVFQLFHLLACLIATSDNNESRHVVQLDPKKLKNNYFNLSGELIFEKSNSATQDEFKSIVEWFVKVFDYHYQQLAIIYLNNNSCNLQPKKQPQLISNAAVNNDEVKL